LREPVTGSRSGGFPSGALPKIDRPGFPITGLECAGVAAAAERGSDNRGNFRESEDPAEADRGLPILGDRKQWQF
jgi:hypothetical protein